MKVSATTIFLVLPVFLALVVGAESPSGIHWASTMDNPRKPYWKVQQPPQNESSQSRGTFGTVKWWSNRKGIGFITVKNGRDVYVHYSALEGEGFKTLREGECVEFDLVESKSGPLAENVVKHDPPMCK